MIEGDLDDDAVLDRLFEAGCDDATFGSIDGVGYGEFRRAARTFPEAVLSAIEDVERRACLHVLHVEPDDLVTMADIAERMGCSREYVRLLVAGRKGPGGFPPPVSHLGERSRLWRWSDVAEWARLSDDRERERASFLAAVNAALELRRARIPSARRARLLRAVPVAGTPAVRPRRAATMGRWPAPS